MSWHNIRLTIQQHRHGYQKLKGSNINATNNLILFPLQSGCLYLTPACRTPALWLFYNNTCVTSGPLEYSFTGMLPSQAVNLCNLPNLRTYDNTFYGVSSTATFTGCDQTPWTWGTWRSKGQDVGSTVTKPVPDPSVLLQWIVQALPWAVATT